jgi:2-methylisocitrate lyase-like PEP mutase family enzyme
MDEQGQQRAATLRGLHVAGDPLILPNAWDAASAKLVAAAGFPAVATTSAGVAAALGYADGEDTPVERVLAAVERIVAAVDVPVTVDFERGYRLAPAELVERFAATGAVGLNLEDSDPATGSMVDPAEQADFLAAVRQATGAHGLVINARTDSFLRQAGTPDECLVTTIDRGRRYLAAGADCVYPLGAGDPAVLKALVEGIQGPVNVAVGPNSPASLGEFAALGVARISFGPGLQRHLYQTFANTLLTSVAGGRNPYRT